ncbi:MAG TPA: hypothetical protein VMI54_17610 [Polyangiaceae bacterium]|nr:hypothetical protein [Polyangiaceae bacterium]
MQPELPLPAAPADLAATLSLPNPAAFYAGIRTLGGARVSALPNSPELALAAGLGLPVQAASALVLDRPAAGALLAAESGATAVVVAFQVRNGRELVLSLSGGATPARRTTVDTKSGLTTLTAPDGSAFGVLGDWLVLASTPDALDTAGPYVTRVLGARSAAASGLRVDFVSAAFPRLASVITARWQALRASLAELADKARAEAGRPADFADPQLILGFAEDVVHRTGARIASSRAATFTLELGADRAELAFELEPAPGSSAASELASSVTGPLDPLLALPRDTVLGLVSRQPPPPNAAEAAPPEGPVESVLDAKLGGIDKTTLRDTVALLARGVGETTVVGLLPDETVVLEGDLRDAGALEQAERSVVAGLNAPELRAELTPFFGKRVVRTRTERVPGFDAPIHHVVLPLAKPGEREPELAWGVHGQALFATLGRAEGASFAALASAPSTSTLGADLELRAAAARRNPASFAAMANLSGLAGAPAYVLFAYGKRGKAARLELELDGAAPSFLGRLVP